MEGVNLFSLAEFSKENFIPKQVHLGETVGVVLLCFESGQSMPVHSHPGAIEIILYGVEGEGAVVIGEEEKPLRKGDLLFCKGEIPIGPKNLGSERFLVLVILVLKKLMEGKI